MDSATEAQWNAWCKAHIELALHEYDEHLAKHLVKWVAEEITKTDDFMLKKLGQLRDELSKQIGELRADLTLQTAVAKGEITELKKHNAA